MSQHNLSMVLAIIFTDLYQMCLLQIMIYHDLLTDSEEEHSTRQQQIEWGRSGGTERQVHSQKRHYTLTGFKEENHRIIKKQKRAVIRIMAKTRIETKKEVRLERARKKTTCQESIFTAHINWLQQTNFFTAYPTLPLPDEDIPPQDLGNIVDLLRRRSSRGNGGYFSGITESESMQSLLSSTTSSGFSALSINSSLALSGMRIDQPLPRSHSQRSSGFVSGLEYGSPSLSVSLTVRHDWENNYQSTNYEQNPEVTNVQLNDNRNLRYPSPIDNPNSCLAEIQREERMQQGMRDVTPEGAIGGIPSENLAERPVISSVEAENSSKVLLNENLKSTRMKSLVCANNQTCQPAHPRQGQQGNLSSSNDPPSSLREPVKDAGDGPTDERNQNLPDDDQVPDRQILFNCNQPFHQADGENELLHSTGSHFGSFNRLHRDPEPTDVVEVDNLVNQEVTGTVGQSTVVKVEGSTNQEATAANGQSTVVVVVGEAQEATGAIGPSSVFVEVDEAQEATTAFGLSLQNLDHSTEDVLDEFLFWDGEGETNQQN